MALCCQVALNLVCGRSFNDLAQYPVFPWVVSDFTSRTLRLDDPATYRDLSRPIGALDEERLAFFRERYKEMPGGERHTSTPSRERAACPVPRFGHHRDSCPACPAPGAQRAPTRTARRRR